MGGKNSASHFQRTMTQVLSNLIGNCVLTYIDDLLAYAKTEQELIAAIEEIFQQLKRYGIVSKASNLVRASD